MAIPLCAARGSTPGARRAKIFSQMLLRRTRSSQVGVTTVFIAMGTKTSAGLMGSKLEKPRSATPITVMGCPLISIARFKTPASPPKRRCRSQRSPDHRLDTQNVEIVARHQLRYASLRQSLVGDIHRILIARRDPAEDSRIAVPRSEEHTSEL